MVVEVILFPAFALLLIVWFVRRYPVNAWRGADLARAELLLGVLWFHAASADGWMYEGRNPLPSAISILLHDLVIGLWMLSPVTGVGLFIYWCVRRRRGSRAVEQIAERDVRPGT